MTEYKVAGAGTFFFLEILCSLQPSGILVFDKVLRVP